MWYHIIVNNYISKGKNMKLTEKTVTRGGFYSFLIALALLLISRALGLDEFGNFSLIINIKLYLMCGLCGFTVALAGLIFETKLDPIFKRLIHFIVLICAFTVLFATTQAGGQSIARKILVAIVVFTLSYIVIFLVTFGIKKLIAFLEKKYEAKAKNSPKAPEEKYTPRYK